MRVQHIWVVKDTRHGKIISSLLTPKSSLMCDLQSSITKFVCQLLVIANHFKSKLSLNSLLNGKLSLSIDKNLYKNYVAKSASYMILNERNTIKSSISIQFYLLRKSQQQSPQGDLYCIVDRTIIDTGKNPTII